MRSYLVVVVLFVTIGVLAHAQLQPLGELGREMPKGVHFLLDGTILAVFRDRFEIYDARFEHVQARFGEGARIGDIALDTTKRYMAGSRYLEDTKKWQAQIWDLTTRKLIRSWSLTHAISYTVVLQLEPPMLAHAAGDTIHLWDWDRMEYRGKLEDERRSSQPSVSTSPSSNQSGPPQTNAIAFSPDGRSLAVASRRLDAEIWDVQTRRLVQHLGEHTGWVSHVAYSPDGRWIVTVRYREPGIYLWDSQTGQLARTWTSGVGAVTELLFSDDSQTLYVASRTGGIQCRNNECTGHDDHLRIWDVASSELLHELGGEGTSLRHVSLSPDGTQVLFQYGGTISLWDLTDMSRHALIQDYFTDWWPILSRDGTSLVTSSPQDLKIWDVPSRSLRSYIQGAPRYFREVDTSPDSQLFAVGRDPWIELRDIHSGEIVEKLGHVSWHTPVAFSATGRYVAVSNWSRGVYLLDRQSPESPIPLNIDEAQSDWMEALAFSERDEYLAGGDSSGRVHLWEWQQDEFVYRYFWRGIPEQDSFRGLAFEPTEFAIPRLVASGRERVTVWKLGRDKPSQELRLDATGPAHFVADGRFLFLNDADGLLIWNWHRQRPVPHPPMPEYTAVNTDGSVLLTKQDGVRMPLIWDVRPLLYPKPVLLGNVKRTVLLPNYPNPFNPETWIPYQLAGESQARIHIHDVAGNLIRQFDLGTRTAGTYQTREQAAYWDGRNLSGEPVSSGLYFCTLETDDTKQVRRMSVVR